MLSVLQKYLVNAALIDLYAHHQHTMINKHQIRDHDGPCAFQIREVAKRRVDGVKGVSGDIEQEVIKRESLNAEYAVAYDLSL